MKPTPWTTRSWSLSAKIGHYTGPRTPRGCREWLGAVDRYGYAILNFGGVTQHVSRHILGLKTGDPLYALHSCDNPACVEPKHLRRGTQAENVAERDARGRNGSLRGAAHPVAKNPNLIRGARNPNAKLSDVQVAEIRARYGADERATLRSLAKEFRVTNAHIGRIVRRVQRQSAEVEIRARVERNAARVDEVAAATLAAFGEANGRS